MAMLMLTALLNPDAPAGRIFLVNLYLGLRSGHISEVIGQRFLVACEARFDTLLSSGIASYEAACLAISDTLRSKDEFHATREPKPDRHGRLARVCRAESFSFAFTESALADAGIRVEHDELEDDFVDRLNELLLEKPHVLKAGASLGGRALSAFLARQETVDSAAQTARPIETLRDWLGLQFLVKLSPSGSPIRTRVVGLLFDWDSLPPGCIAAPTALEAGMYERFWALGSQGRTDNWGCTVNLEKLASAAVRGVMPAGAAEAIVKLVTLAELDFVLEDLHILAKEPPACDGHDFISLLADGCDLEDLTSALNKLRDTGTL